MFQAKHCRRSHSTSILACRYLFFLMSATASKDVMQTCLKILQEKISDTNEPFSVQVPDLLIVLMNYGTVRSRLWSDDIHISIPRAFRHYPMNSFDSTANRSLPFPRFNLEKVLTLVRFNVTTYPYFSESEKGGLFHLMLNLSMANFVVGDTFLILIIRDIICSILESFRVEEWDELDFKMVFTVFILFSYFTITADLLLLAGGRACFAMLEWWVGCNGNCSKN